jgi:hypothetical protein
MIHPYHFQLIQKKIGSIFTLDACANPSGDNALCPNYCSTENSFLKHNCKVDNVWLNPPFSRNTIRTMILHYRHCKQQAPYTTSACILLPEWIIPSISHYLEGMTIIHTFSENELVMTVPAHPQDPNQDRLLFNQGLPFTMVVFYDPPQPLPKDQTTSLRSLSPEPSFDIIKAKGLLTDCTIARTIPARVSIGLPSTSATLAIDTLASRNFIDYSLIKDLNIKIKKHPSWLTNTITLGDNSERQTLGIAHVQIKVGTYQDMIWCEVLPLPPDFQIILGQAWLTKHQCLLNFADNTCTIHQNNRRHLIHCGQHQPAPTLKSSKKDTSTNLISALQAKRALKKSLSLEPERCFLLLLETQDHQIQAIDSIPPAVKTILDKHPKAISEPPIGLPPTREVEHTIELEQGSSPPQKATSNPAHHPMEHLSYSSAKRTAHFVCV